MVIGGTNFKGLGSGGIGVLELDATTVGCLASVHAADVDEVDTTDGSEPEFDACLEWSAVTLDVNLGSVGTLRQFVGEA